MGFPVTASHSRAVLSSLPVRSRRSVGANGHGHDRALMVHGRPDELAGRRVPTPRRAVVVSA